MNLIKNRELRNDIMKTMFKNNDLTQGKIWKVILNFTLPIFLGTLFQSLYTTIDAIIVGKFAGKDAFAAIESVMSFQRLPVSFFIKQCKNTCDSSTPRVLVMRHVLLEYELHEDFSKHIGKLVCRHGAKPCNKETELLGSLKASITTTQ